MTTNRFLFKNPDHYTFLSESLVYTKHKQQEAGFGLLCLEVDKDVGSIFFINRH